jgi:hypothetical protein
MCDEEGGGHAKPLSAKEITMKKPSKSAPQAHLNGNGQASTGTANPIPSGAPAVLANKHTVVTAKTVAVKPAKSARRPPRAASGSNPEKLVCRYCSSDDLAPSFIKRRDARCRACFKQRYGATARHENPTHPRKAAAAK